MPFLSLLSTHRRLAFDIVARICLALFFAFSAGQYFKNAFYHLTYVNQGTPDVKMVVAGFSILAIGFYSIMLAILFAVRMQPRNKFAGIRPACAALLGGFLMMGLMWIKPNEDLPLAVSLVASGLVLIGSLFSFIVLLHLGKSFSILPEGRRLVTSGPYKYIRHPLYLAEGIGVIGAMITFWSWEAVALVVAQMIFQFLRMRYEERVLCATFPEYEIYAAHTARVIPGFF